MDGFKIKNKKLCLAILFAIVLVFLPTHLVNAFGIESIATNAISSVFGWLLFVMFSAVGQVISLLAAGLYQVINIPVYPNGGLAVIYESWKIMRDFANMFFIVALIVMAFATIFDILPGAARYNARALFGKFLLTALLINFSLVLGVMVIQGTQILSNTFLTSIGDMSGRLGQGLVNNIPLNPDQISANAFANALDNAVFGTIITLIFSVVLLFTFAFSLLTAFLFALIRIPILWALLIVSPIAWILNIFPSGQGTFKKWWGTFIGWNMFLPIFLFFLYFGLYFLQNQGAVLSKIATQTANQPLGGSSFTLQILFFYVLSGIFLIGGTIVAMKASMFSGTGVVGIATWSRGVAARRLGLTAMGGAAQQRLEQVKQEGLPGRFGKLYGGKAGLERQTSGWAERFGVRGAADKQLAKDIAANKEKFKTVTDPAQLRARMSTGSRQEQLAIREIMKDKGLLDNAGLEETYKMYGGNQTLAGKQFARSINYDKLSGLERNNWYRQTTDIETKQKIAGVMADKGEFNTVADIQSALSLYSLPGDRANLLKKAGRHITDNSLLRPLMAAGTEEERLAVREILAERKALTGAELFDTYSMYKAGSKEAIDFATKIDFEALTDTDRQNWYTTAPDVEVKRRVAEVMADKGELRTPTPVDALVNAANQYTTDAEKIKFLQKAEKKNFMATIQAKATLGIVRNSAGAVLINPNDVLQDRIRKMGAKDIAEVGYDGGWAEATFRDAVQDKINARQASQPSIPPQPANPALPIGPTNPLVPGKVGGGEKLKTDLQNEAGDPRSLAQISALIVP